ncbi:Holliday junction branch migration protein RuvA [Candidatus Puniceispirillum sp.]|nr:Holliday junction branch migration protein RuvA [Candidatus Puniceispirillum sp.]
MIVQLCGSIVQTDDQHTILDVHGVGYAVHVSGRTQSQLETMSGEVTLLTEMQVREDSMTLFGFLDFAERDAFRLLTTVQGVGAKAAMAILSVLAPADLTNAIISGDKAMVARADGVGPKIAQRVVNELGEKIVKISTLGGALSIGDAKGGTSMVGEAGVIVAAGLFGDAVSALANLGYGRAEAHSAVMRVQTKSSSDNLSDVIAAALREIGA